jgi:hypothetical protein
MDRVLHYQWRAAEILFFIFILPSFVVLLSLLIGWLVMGVVRVSAGPSANPDDSKRSTIDWRISSTASIPCSWQCLERGLPSPP